MNILEALVQTRNSIQSWVASNLAAKADKNYVDEQLDAIADIASASGCKIITGTYVGTGGDGVDGTVSLTFDFAPTVLILFSENGRICMGGHNSSDGQNIPAIGFPQALTTSFAAGLFINWYEGNIVAKRSDDGKTISWYHNGRTYDEETDEYYPVGSHNAFNNSGVTYNYFAIS